MNNQIFKQKRDCCGCGACQAICPKNAIDMVEDEYGFVYPKINEEKCINCGLCKKICTYKNPRVSSEEKKVFMAVSKNEDKLKKSASGGVFFELAYAIIIKGGIVYGCSMEKENDKLYPKHIRVNNVQELIKLQGSKYVQSECGMIYNLVKKDLLENKIVLFSGTPCQIEGLKSFLLYKQYDNLYLVDIICHGVPNRKMFQDYISLFENKNKCRVTDYYFRDKANGCGYNNKTKYEKNGSNYVIVKKAYESSYCQLFLDSAICRENCYICPYACENRNSDITIGDYWGAGKEHPNCSMDENKGISCVIANTSKGNMLINKYGNQMEKIDSDFKKVARHNHQLNQPSKFSGERTKILKIYKELGYQGVEIYYRQTRGIKNFLKKIRDIIKGV